MPKELENLILLLLREGHRNHAVEIYREETGAARMDAKRAVADVADTHGVSAGHSMMTDVVLVLLTVGAALLGFFGP